jgi:hypothetical protein
MTTQVVELTLTQTLVLTGICAVLLMLVGVTAYGKRR